MSLVTTMPTPLHNRQKMNLLKKKIVWLGEQELHAWRSVIDVCTTDRNDICLIIKSGKKEYVAWRAGAAHMEV